MKKYQKRKIINITKDSSVKVLMRKCPNSLNNEKLEKLKEISLQNIKKK